MVQSRTSVRTDLVGHPIYNEHWFRLCRSAALAAAVVLTWPAITQAAAATAATDDRAARSDNSAPPPLMALSGQFDVSALGAATYSIPIAIPPGTAGMKPVLALEYSSSYGDGIIGIGWTLKGLPTITRCPKTLAQDHVYGGVNFDSADRFCFAGQRLMLVSGAYGQDGAVYRTEIDQFSKFISHGVAGTGPQWFEVFTKGGQVLQFGNSTDSRALVVNAQTGVVGPTARLWAINRVGDRNSNFIKITYVNDTTEGQIYPDQIDYTYTTASPTVAFNQVKFSYTTRSDATATYLAGAKVRLTKLLSHIVTKAAGATVYDYKFLYDAGSPEGPHTQLKSLTLCDATTHCLAPTNFTWQGSGGGLTYSTVVPNVVGTPGDYNGDGITDMMVPNYTTKSTTLYLGGSTPGTYTVTTATLSVPSPPASYNIALSTNPDVNGDGIDDVAWTYLNSSQTQFTGYFRGSTSATLTQLGTTSTTASRFMSNFNGDGWPDYLSIFMGSNPPATSTLTPYLGQGDGTFVGGTAISGSAGTALRGDYYGDGCTDVPRSLSSGTSDFYDFCAPSRNRATLPFQFDGSHIPTQGDFNGDGIVDLLIQYIPFTVPPPPPADSIYFFTGQNNIQGAVSTLPQYGGTNFYQAVAGDWNGDGKTDLALISNHSGTPHLIYLSTGTDFVQEISIPNSVTTMPVILQAVVADLNNDGAQDILIENSSGNVIILFPNTPQLLTGVSNGIGVTTAIAYDRINKNGSFYTRANNASYPTVDVNGASYVVKSVAKSDGIGGTHLWTYAYSGLKRDALGRGSLSFTGVTVTDNQTGIVQATTYNTAFPLSGTPSQIVEKSGAIVLNQIDTNYSSDTMPAGPDGTVAYFVGESKVVSSGHDLDNNPTPTITTLKSYDCDTTTAPCYGEQTYEEVDRPDGSYRKTTTTFTDDGTLWLLNQATSVVASSKVGSSIITRASSASYYPTTGLLKQEVVEPNTASYLLTTDYGYDQFGNRNLVTQSGFGIVTRSSSVTYDAQGVFPTTIENALLQDETWGYSAAFGGPTQHLSIDNVTSSWSYDEVGRLQTETQTDGTKIALSYAYCSGVNGGTASCPTLAAYLVQTDSKTSGGAVNGPTMINYYDAVNRLIAQDKQGFDGAWVRVEMQYNALGKIAQSSKAYCLVITSTCALGTKRWTVNEYDILSRIKKTTFPDTSFTTYAYQGETVAHPGVTASVTNANSQTVTKVLNDEGLVATVIDANGKTSSYGYDAFDGVIKITAPSGAISTFVNDRRGRRTSASDPDKGSWTFTYDALDEMLTQTNARNQTTTFTYNEMKQLKSQTENNGVSNDQVSVWTYGTTLASHDVGKEITVTSTGVASGPTSYTRVQTYDLKGRPSKQTITVDGTTASYTIGYDSTTGRRASLAYPSGFTVKYLYTGLGYLCQIADTASTNANCSGTNLVYWKINSRDPEMHITDQQGGNGVGVTQTFDANTGLVKQIQASSGIAAFSYSYDPVGNLQNRADTISSVSETFTYDTLNRVRTASIAGGSTTTTGYNDDGNISSKSEIGSPNGGNYNWTYAYSNPAHIHAVSGITTDLTGGKIGVNGVANPTYSYDADGNMTAGDGRTVTYYSSGMTATLSAGSPNFIYYYDAEHHRIEQGGSTTTRYFNDIYTGALSEQRLTPTAEWHDYIVLDGRLVAEHVKGASQTVNYFVTDHLGSIAVVTLANGTLAPNGRLTYDAWGRPRNPSGSDDLTCANSAASPTTRGYTGQEQIAAACLVNLNARIYDPTIGRFMSADSVIDDIYNAQNLNHFTYVNNGPLTATDPTGNNVVIITIPPPKSMVQSDPDYHCYGSCTGATITELVAGDVSGSAANNQIVIIGPVKGGDLSKTTIKVVDAEGNVQTKTLVRVAFIDGFRGEAAGEDGTRVNDYQKDFSNSNRTRNVQSVYFSWTDKASAGQWIDQAKGGDVTIVIGQSLGGSAAGDLAVRHPGMITLLITVDPVTGLFNFDYQTPRAIKASVGYWIDISEPTPYGLHNWTNNYKVSIAWGATVKDYANIFIEHTSLVHGDIYGSMRTFQQHNLLPSGISWPIYPNQTQPH